MKNPSLLTTLALLILTFSTNSHTAQELVAVEGAGYNVSDTLSSNLKVLRGKKAHVILNSGKTISGYIKDVGDKLVHIEKLDGKEYFDGLIRIDSIDSIDIQFRAYKQ